MSKSDYVKPQMTVRCLLYNVSMLRSSSYGGVDISDEPPIGGFDARERYGTKDDWNYEW